MTRKGKYVLAGVAAACVGLVAAGAMAQRGHWDGHKGRHGGGGYGAGIMGLGFGGPSGKICRGKSAEVTDIMLVRLEHRVDITDAQKAAFEEFKTATRTAAEKLREGCPKKPDTTANEDDKAAAPKVTPLDRLAQTQVGLEASLEALKTYRPAAEKFYAALSDEQKAKLTDRRGGGKRHWKRDGAPHDRGDRDGPDRDDSPTPSTPNDKG
ncbi:Spy/CpxP family protein refolding chaperone [Hyphomicrobium sp.]|uniref:Spy/CpxP family protein refolding chaperone n=1 Tax=Hyphomicrobium sp. TaxID=82 RepID=UPI003F70BE01